MTKRKEKEISNIEVSTTVPLGYLVGGGAFVKRMKEDFPGYEDRTQIGEVKALELVGDEI
ncbi:uncharacterized protein RAG0_12882 [Rhynchosporium agropyri]|uniref:Uncharacterized protein n=1 Tax=Rhynchosporium agropyri TaxID=914238 RepID=A0A1E1LA85_9HELO|nr:uncharacterized protein RAG0_12882 [Rhynchosporium agropyri]